MTEEEEEQAYKQVERLGFIIDTEKNQAEPVFFRACLESYYSLLNVDLIDIREGMLEGHFFDFIVDDEGLLKEDPKASIFDKEGKPLLVGNVLICHNDPETGREYELTKEDISLLLRHVCQVTDTKTGKTWKGLHGLEM